MIVEKGGGELVLRSKVTVLVIRMYAYEMTIRVFGWRFTPWGIGGKWKKKKHQGYMPPQRYFSLQACGQGKENGLPQRHVPPRRTY